MLTSIWTALNELYYVDRLKTNVLYATENSSQPCCLRIVVQNEEKDDKKGKDMIKDGGFK